MCLLSICVCNCCPLCMHLLSIMYASALDCVCICFRLCLQPNRSNGASSKPVLDSLFWSGWPHLSRNRTEAGFSIDFGFRCTRWSAMHVHWPSCRPALPRPAAAPRYRGVQVPRYQGAWLPVYLGTPVSRHPVRYLGR